MNDINTLYSLWSEKAVADADLIEELNGIRGNEDEILDRFYKNLEFGTGGLRGVIGAGTNRMNIYTVNQATQGLADYLNSAFQSPSVAIAYDSRIKSEFLDVVQLLPYLHPVFARSLLFFVDYYARRFLPVAAAHYFSLVSKLIGAYFADCIFGVCSTNRAVMNSVFNFF